jgi:hypothetical protein
MYNVIYPALETQILSLVWWLLLMLCLRYEEESTPVEGKSEQQQDHSSNGLRGQPHLVEH